MAKVAFFIDGFNLYHALDFFEGGPNPFRYRKYKWLSLLKLVSCYITKKDTISEILYFTTLAKWDPAKVARHRLYIKAQEAEGIQVVYGEFKRKRRRCSLCNKTFWTREEKQTDVNIAIKLFQFAVEGKYDKAIIISGDTDLIPATKAVRASYPGKEIGVVIPIGRASEDFKKQTDFHYKMKEIHLSSSRYPNTITLKDGTTINCPPTWR